MSFKEHTKKNWLITFFAAIFAASVVVMIFFDEPRNTVVISLAFVAFAVLSFLLILVIWLWLSNRKQRVQGDGTQSNSQSKQDKSAAS
ncbi:hypothetical protein M3B03_04130 [Corynebacterium pseudodiphtheriticum]|uniref:hypothetical protein n=1 Tax=Corynebacterium pseudodiphtheriticum TaxID=37637 RepID=UPI00223B9C19|nr:hypothetical protein [Corynebacterium pseudodiphtheriticum]MCT1634891.1 hypothetical protein [Corynebacterium pseudodiphtheriticum]MCT1665984.1 hypothetical protein [Corynebacterium pseudodiphtheriticum]